MQVDLWQVRQILCAGLAFCGSLAVWTRRLVNQASCFEPFEYVTVACLLFAFSWLCRGAAVMCQFAGHVQSWECLARVCPTRNVPLQCLIKAQTL